METMTWKQRVAIGILCVCVLIYSLYHFASLFGEDMSTVAAGVVTETDSISGTGYVFRDETVLYSNQGGVVHYLCDDGSKVRSGQSVAEVYQNGTSSDRQRMALLDHQIAILEESTSATTVEDISALQASVNDQYYILVRMLAAGETGKLGNQIDNLLVDMNRLDAEIEEEPIAKTTLETLKDRKESMLSSGGAVQTESTPREGYFYTSADGLETVFTEDAFENLTADSFFEAISKKGRLQSDGTAYGKIASDSRWGFVMEIPFSEADFFEVGEVYDLEFTENNGVSLPMTLERSIGVAERKSVLLLLRCDRLPADFSFTRAQSVRIETDSISGLYVPKKAVSYVDEMAGVYILRGSVVHFRYVEIIYEGSDYYLVLEDVEDDEDFIYLGANDRIILNGKNLFDGRILE